jgi:murein DD-endopeptidase MepM/ murein hydrolase activator NlpD
MVLSMSKDLTRRISMVLAFVMLVLTLVTVIEAITPGAQASTQARINALREERRRLDGQRQEVQERIANIEFEQLTQIAQKGVLDDRMMLTWQEIEHVNEIIELYQQLIIEKELDVRAAQARENEQLADYRSRVRSMEESGIISYLEILFDSTSFADLLARWDFIGDIMRADERAFHNLTVAREETEAAEEALRETRVGLEEERAQLVLRENELEEQIEEANDLIMQIADTLEGEQALYEQNAAESRRINAEIDRLVEQQRREEERRRQEALRAAREAANNNSGNEGDSANTAPAPPSGPTGGSGQLMWPVSGHIGSEFGPRRGRMHLGIDIMAPHGTPVVAADGGTVLVRAFSGGWGNHIVINHGNGMTTLYAHLSSMNVSVGQSVSRGQNIGNVGSSGNATAPHLHFEVRVNGVHMNPRDFLG